MTISSCGGIGGVPAMPEIKEGSSVKKLTVAEQQLSQAIDNLERLGSKTTDPKIQAMLQASLAKIKDRFSQIMSIKYGETADQIAGNVADANQIIASSQGQISQINQEIQSLTAEVGQLTQQLTVAQQDLAQATAVRDDYAAKVITGDARPPAVLPDVLALKDSITNFDQFMSVSWGLFEGMNAYTDFHAIALEFNNIFNNSGGQLSPNDLGSFKNLWSGWISKYSGTIGQIDPPPPFPLTVVQGHVIALNTSLTVATTATSTAVNDLFASLQLTVTQKSDQVNYYQGLINADNLQLAALNAQLVDLQLKLQQAEASLSFFQSLTPLEKQLLRELYPNIVFPA